MKETAQNIPQIAQTGPAVLDEIVTPLNEVKEEEVLTADEVAALLRLDRKSVYLAAQHGELPCLRLGRILRFSRQAVLNSLSQSCVVPLQKGGNHGGSTR